VSAILDAGALMGVDRRDRRVGALLRALQQDGVDVLCSAGAVAQVWRDGRRQVNLARVLAGVEIAQLDEPAAKRVGALLKANRTQDLVDAHAALLARPRDVVLTSDDADIKALLRVRRVKATTVHV
jgi:hypothetical protein